jgi:hypothetical protein
MGQKETATTNKNRVMIYGPKTDDTYPLPNSICPRMLQRALLAHFIAPCLPTKAHETAAW